MRLDLPLVAATALLAPLAPAQVINEIRVDQAGADDDEYFELAGAPGSSLDGLTYLVLGDGAAGSGVIEEVTSLDGLTIPVSGFFVAAEGSFTLGTADLVTSLNFENSDNVTHLLVRDFVGSNGDDLDVDDDGTLDILPWSEVVDRVALLEESGVPTGTEFAYGSPAAGPDGSFVPGHVIRQASSDSLVLWGAGRFDVLGGLDTPGAPNSGFVRISAAAGGAVELQMDATPAKAGFFYFIAYGTSGTSPGTVLPSTLVLPLNYDPFFELSLLNAGTPPFAGSFGLLDGNGRSPFANFRVPSVPSLAGMTFNAAGFTLSPVSSFISFVTTPVEVLLD